jgi:ribosome-associated toxin RatA of RatAB toxin-antitoxin module
VPEVTVRAVTAQFTADEAYQRISEFERYPEMTAAVEKVVVHPRDGDGWVQSEWTAHFRNGLLRWCERDAFDAEQRKITFEQVTGDFAEFSGTWLVEPTPTGAVVTFSATFDLGIPTLAPILDPVAESALRNNIGLILAGLLGSETEIGSTAAEPVRGPA